MFAIQIHPMINELTEKISVLKNELANHIAKRDHLVNHVIPLLDAEYQTKIGYKIFEKFSLQYSVMKTRRKIELIQAQINNDQPVINDEIENQLNQEFLEWQKQTDELYKKIIESEIIVNAEKISFDETCQLKELYRKFVFLLHPDINSKLTEQDRQMWFEVFNAYKNCDLRTLKALAVLLEMVIEPDPIKNKSSIEILEEKYAVLKNQIIEVIKYTQKLNNSFPCNIALKLEDKKWVASQLKEIESEISRFKTEKLALKSILEEFIVCKK